jgi:hypothetical protein
MSASGFPRQRGAAPGLEPHHRTPEPDHGWDHSQDIPVPEQRPSRRHAAPDTGTDIARFGGYEPEADADHGYGLSTGGIARPSGAGGTYGSASSTYGEDEYQQNVYGQGTYGTAGYGSSDYDEGNEAHAENDYGYDASGFSSAGSYDYGGDGGFGYGRDAMDEAPNTYGSGTTYGSNRDDRYDDGEADAYGPDPLAVPNRDRAERRRW